MSEWWNYNPGRIIEMPRTDDASKAYEYILKTIVPDSIEFFRSKTKDYEGGPAFLLLGARGQFSDINRKFWKLYQAIWEGETLEGEQPEEIVNDFIGHCWLLLYCLRHDRAGMIPEAMSSAMNMRYGEANEIEPTAEGRRAWA